MWGQLDEGKGEKKNQIKEEKDNMMTSGRILLKIEIVMIQTKFYKPW